MHLFCCYEKKGSLAIEASLIMPGIISAIIFIIYAGFYYYDRCVMERAAYSAVLKCGTGYIYDCDHINIDCGLDTIEEEVESKFYEYVRNRLAGSWELECNALAEDQAIMIRVIGRMSWPGGFFTEYLGGGFFSIDITESSMNLYEPLYIRE